MPIFDVVFNALRQLVSDIDWPVIKWMPKRKFFGNREFTI
jgi:hypothetical protein